MVANDTSASPVSQLAEQHMDIARTVTCRLKRHFSWIDMDDLRSYSLWGLTRAAGVYMPERGTPFINFASKKAFFFAIDAMREDKVLRRKSTSTKTVKPQRFSLEDRCELSDLADDHTGREALRMEMRDLLAHLMGRLDVEDRRLLLLRYVDGLTFKEIAKIYDRTEPAICLRNKALISKLRRLAKIPTV